MLRVCLRALTCPLESELLLHSIRSSGNSRVPAIMFARTAAAPSPCKMRLARTPSPRASSLPRRRGSRRMKDPTAISLRELGRTSSAIEGRCEERSIREVVSLRDRQEPLRERVGAGRGSSFPSENRAASREAPWTYRLSAPVWHRINRSAASAAPLRKPYSLIASSAYCEQLGSKRQCPYRRSDMYLLIETDRV